MKVFNLRCGAGHDFEGWFASEEDFLTQQERGLLSCPECGDMQVDKMLSAPHINLGHGKPQPVPAPVSEEQRQRRQVVQAMYERMVQHVIENTEDVGDAFPEQARKMHYGKLDEAPIRGQASPEETDALREEGIDVVSLPIPKASQGKLQ